MNARRSAIDAIVLILLLFLSGCSKSSGREKNTEYAFIDDSQAANDIAWSPGDPPIDQLEFFKMTDATVLVSSNVDQIIRIIECDQPDMAKLGLITVESFYYRNAVSEAAHQRLFWVALRTSLTSDESSMRALAMKALARAPGVSDDMWGEYLKSAAVNHPSNAALVRALQAKR